MVDIISRGFYYHVWCDRKNKKASPHQPAPKSEHATCERIDNSLVVMIVFSILSSSKQKGLDPPLAPPESFMFLFTGSMIHKHFVPEETCVFSPLAKLSISGCLHPF